MSREIPLPPQWPVVGEKPVPLGDLVEHRRRPDRLAAAMRSLGRTYKKVSINAVASGALAPGTKVVVVGRAEPFGSDLILYGINTASAQIFVATATLSKQQIATIAGDCKAFCKAVVAGRVTPVPGSPGLAATIVLTAAAATPEQGRRL